MAENKDKSHTDLKARFLVDLNILLNKDYGRYLHSEYHETHNVPAEKKELAELRNKIFLLVNK